MDFVLSAAILYAETYGIERKTFFTRPSPLPSLTCLDPPCSTIAALSLRPFIPSLLYRPSQLPSLLTAVKDRQYLKDRASAIKVAPFVPRSGVTIHTTDSEANAAASGTPGLFSADNAFYRFGI